MSVSITGVLEISNLTPGEAPFISGCVFFFFLTVRADRNNMAHRHQSMSTGGLGVSRNDSLGWWLVGIKASEKL